MGCAISIANTGELGPKELTINDYKLEKIGKIGSGAYG